MTHRERIEAAIAGKKVDRIPAVFRLDKWYRARVCANDLPDIVLEAVEEAETAYRKMWPIVAESPAKLILHGVNFSTQMTPPPVFRERFLPYLTQFNRQMHQAGKRVALHADGDLTGLLKFMLEAGFDVADCGCCHDQSPKRKRRVLAGATQNPSLARGALRTPSERSRISACYLETGWVARCESLLPKTAGANNHASSRHRLCRGPGAPAGDPAFAGIRRPGAVRRRCT